MKHFGKTLLFMGLFLSLILTACDGKKQVDNDLEDEDTDGDGVADIDDVFPEDPTFANLALSTTAKDLASQVQSVGGIPQALGAEGKVVSKADALEIGRCDEPSIAKMDMDRSEVPVMYVDRERMDRICPDRGHGKPFQCNTVALLGDKTVTDFRLDVTVASSPDESWGILFRSDELKGYMFSYDPWAHRWAKWANGESWPFGVYSLQTIIGMKSDGQHTDQKNIISKAFQSKPTKTVQQITIIALGPKITVYEGDQLIFAVEDSTFQSGKVGFRTWLGSCMKVRNLSIAEKLEAPAE